MGRLIGVALAVLVGGCGTNVDLGIAKKGVNAGPAGTGGSSEDASVGPQGGSAGETTASGTGTGGREGSGGAEPAPPAMGAGGAATVPPAIGAGGTPMVTPPSGEAGGACGMILPDPTPLPLIGTAEKNCADAANATDWQLPLTSAGGADPSDKRASIVGRWVPCGDSPIGPAGTRGIEFGGNGRFRWLHDDADAGLTPGADSGYFYLFTENMGGPLAQLNLYIQDGGALLIGFQMRPNGQAFQSNGIIYGRTEPSPENGRDNPPSVRGKSCSLVGTWDTIDASSQPVALWFDDQGHFVGGAADSDVCATPLFRGTYELTPDDMFAITTSRGMDHCQWWFNAGYSAFFSSDCDVVTLTNTYDNCTGGRGYLTGITSKLTRRVSR